MKPIPILCFLSLIATSAFAEDPLPSWNDGANKSAVLDFVTAVTMEGGEQYVPPVECIATFDNDGCLWSEQPAYFELLFAVDRVKATAANHPGWKETQPFKAVLEDDREALLAAGDGPRFGLLVHHTDAEREWAYDRDSHVGKLDRGLDEGPKRRWHLVDMKRDWKAIYPAPK